MLSYLRSHLWLKLFLSYLLVILVGVLVIGVTVNLAAPQAYQRHLAAMSAMMEGEGGMMTIPGRGRGFGPMMGTTLYSGFRQAVDDALTRAIIVAVLVAALASLLLARQVIAPLRAIRIASHRIAEGHYSERVPLPAARSPEQLDELGQLALSFNQMAQQLEETENMRRQLIGDVAHELRTPLTMIKGSMEGLIDGILPAEVETYQSIYRETERLNHLVDDLQELSRVEAGAYQLELHIASLHELVEAVVASLGRQFEEKGVSLQTDLPPDLPLVEIDAHRITQVLTNLIANALQYTPSGGRVTVSARRQANEVLVQVRDTGIGIPAEHLPHVFDRFYRVDKSRSRAGGGSGIGLTIARHLVEAHGGRIWAESPGPGRGSTFSFSLPLTHH